MLGVHAVRSWLLSEATDVELLIDWAFVPLRWTAAYGGLAPGDILATLALEPSQPERSLQLELAQYVLSEGAAKPWTGLTYAFLHGSWAHVAASTASGSRPSARRWRAAAAGCGSLLSPRSPPCGGALAYVLVHPYQALPMIGASAAVSGMMAAAAWFMFAPRVWLPRAAGASRTSVRGRRLQRARPQPARPDLSRRSGSGPTTLRGPGAAPRRDRCEHRLGGAYRRLPRRLASCFPCSIPLPPAGPRGGLKLAPNSPDHQCRRTGSASG